MESHRYWRVIQACGSCNALDLTLTYIKQIQPEEILKVLIEVAEGTESEGPLRILYYELLSRRGIEIFPEQFLAVWVNVSWTNADTHIGNAAKPSFNIKLRYSQPDIVHSTVITSQMDDDYLGAKFFCVENC